MSPASQSRSAKAGILNNRKMNYEGLILGGRWWGIPAYAGMTAWEYHFNKIRAGASDFALLRLTGWAEAEVGLCMRETPSWPGVGALLAGTLDVVSINN